MKVCYNFNTKISIIIYLQILLIRIKIGAYEAIIKI